MGAQKNPRNFPKHRAIMQVAALRGAGGTTLRYLLCLVLLCACSSTQKRHVYYCDGLEASCPPEAFAHPGYTPAGAGLPEYRPTEEEPEVPRSPHKRVLPPRREATIWAGDEPKAGVYDKPWPVTPSDANYTRQVMGGFDVPDDLATEFPVETSKMVLRCQWNITQAFLRVPSYRRLSTFPSPVQQCANARLYLHCFESNAAKYNEIRKKYHSLEDPLLERVLRGLLAKARVDRLRVCRGTQLPDEVADTVDGVNAAFDRMMETGDGKSLGDLPKLEVPGGPKH